MRILVVDDDPLGARMVQFLLTEQGYTVDTTDSARGAIALLDAHVPDLILLDVNLPHLNGFDFCKRLRDAGFEMPVIFVTAKGELEDRLQGLRIGADDYICKPFQPVTTSGSRVGSDDESVGGNTASRGGNDLSGRFMR